MHDSKKQWTYYIYDSRIDPQFKTRVLKILGQNQWSRYTLNQVTDPSLADIRIRLSPRRVLDKWHVNKEYYPSGKQIRFSMTINMEDIYIDAENWTKGVRESGMTLGQYRQYVILHEMGHALGYDHLPCNRKTAYNGACPVMYQGTRGAPRGFKPGFNVTPADYTKMIKLARLNVQY
jgi:hypothetical protein